MIRIARTFLFLALLLAAFLLGAGCARDVVLSDVRVVRVVDGDTVELAVRHTPEGKAATAALGELLASGRVSFTDVGRGGFGRRACEVSVEQSHENWAIESIRVNASDELIRLGHAQPWRPE